LATNVCDIDSKGKGGSADGKLCGILGPSKKIEGANGGLFHAPKGGETFIMAQARQRKAGGWSTDWRENLWEKKGSTGVRETLAMRDESHD